MKNFIRWTKVSNKMSYHQYSTCPREGPKLMLDFSDLIRPGIFSRILAAELNLGFTQIQTADTQCMQLSQTEGRFFLL